MKKVRLHKTFGYPIMNEKNQGVFASESKGIYKDKNGKEHPYHKARLTQIYHGKDSKDPNTISMQRPYRYLTFDVEMIPDVVDLLKQVYLDVFKKELFKGEVKKPEPKKEMTEEDQVDELMGELEQMGRRR